MSTSNPPLEQMCRQVLELGIVERKENGSGRKNAAPDVLTLTEPSLSHLPTRFRHRGPTQLSRYYMTVPGSAHCCLSLQILNVEQIYIFAVNFFLMFGKQTGAA
jgi:hypothetical protein